MPNRRQIRKRRSNLVLLRHEMTVAASARRWGFKIFVPIWRAVHASVYPTSRAHRGWFLHRLTQTATGIGKTDNHPRQYEMEIWAICEEEGGKKKDNIPVYMLKAARQCGRGCALRWRRCCRPLAWDCHLWKLLSEVGEEVIARLL